MFEKIVTEPAQVGKNFPVFRLGIRRRSVVVCEYGNPPVAFNLVAMVCHHRIDGVLDRAAMERHVLLSQLRSVEEVDDEREEYVLFFLTVYVEVGNAVAEVVCHTVQFRVCGSKCVQSAQQLVSILACVPVMELQNIVDKQVEVPCLKGNCRIKVVPVNVIG